ncbi:MAG: hypothetical protein BGO11_16735 [Solirubrobacterales bacterium 70-9]|nr:MAG: hypothetical protein BGO11_16735 [Solirubrobacterales bacterium 70-9]
MPDGLDIPTKETSMIDRIRRHITYANVTATLALFVALGGTAFAATKLTGRDLKGHSLTARNYHRDSVTGAAVKEKTLGVVPKAREAARLDGLTAERLLVSCPEGTLPVADTCIETVARAPQYFSAALHECASIESQTGPGRRLPTYDELAAALTHEQIVLGAGGEFTSQVYPSSSKPGLVEDLYVTSVTANVALVLDNAEFPKSFRCVTDPRN